MQKFFGNYFGVDFLAMIFAILSVYFLAEKRRGGFIFALLANFTFLFVNFLAGIFGGMILNFILIILNFRGFLKWKNSKF